MAKNRKCDIDVFGDTLEEMLREYASDIKENAYNSSETIAKKGAKMLRSSGATPRRSGAYAKDWRYKRSGNGSTIYNRRHYQLAHLLENSHVIANQHGTYGNTKPQPHIKPVEEIIVNEYYEKVRRIIKET